MSYQPDLSTAEGRMVADFLDVFAQYEAEHNQTVTDALPWNWSIEGSEIASGTVERTFTDSDVIHAESAGEALVLLAERGPFWDVLDTDKPFTLRINPGGERP